MEAYVAVKPSGGQEGNFWFTLAGTEKLRLEFLVNKILPSPAFENMIIELEMVPGDQIRLERNSACSTWWDVEDLVASQDVMVSNGKGKDMSEEFLAAVGHDKTLMNQSAERQGICMRWMVGTKTGSKQVLMLAQVSYRYRKFAVKTLQCGNLY